MSGQDGQQSDSKRAPAAKVIDPLMSPSAVVRLVDQSGVQWTYGSVADVPIEHQELLSSSAINMQMFESPPMRDPWEREQEVIPAVEIAPERRGSPMWWIITGLVIAALGLVAAVWVLLS